jgi:hypothetical protein
MRAVANWLVAGMKMTKKVKLKLQKVINARLDLLEERLAGGWSYQMVVDDLAEVGIEMTVKYFSQCLAIARAARIKGGLVKTVEPVKGEERAQQVEIKSKPVAESAKVAESSKTGPAQNRFELKKLSDKDLFGE